MSPSTFSLITTLSIVFIAAIIGGAIAKKLKLPYIVGYIASGIVIGNLLSRAIDTNFLTLISEAGVTLLLFTLGIEFSFRRIEQVIGTIGWAAILQVLVSTIIILGVLLGFGFSFVPGLFIAAAAALSSTAIVVRLLSGTGELETSPGEITTGWLVVQDLAVVPMMILLPAIASLSLAHTTISSAGLSLLVSLLKATVFLTGFFFIGRRVLPRVLNFFASVGSRELFLVTTVAVVFFAGIISYAFGLSAAVGAFIAGLLVADTSQNHAIFSEIRPLRDLFVVVFFVTLGLALPVSFLITNWFPIVGITLVIFIVKWTIVYGLCRFLGYHKKTAFLISIALTELSEFGFVIAAEGRNLGILTQNHSSFLIAVTSLSIFISVPLITYGHTLSHLFYETLGKWLPTVFTTKELISPKQEEYPIADHIVLCGYGRVGKYIGRALEMSGVPFLVIDYDQGTIAKLRARGIHAVYGDPGDRGVLDYAQVDLARAIIIAIPDRHTQEMIIGNAQTLNRRIRIICRSHFEEDQKRLKSLGVHTVVQPEFEASISIVEKLLADFGVSSDDIAGKISRLKIEHGLG